MKRSVCGALVALSVSCYLGPIASGSSEAREIDVAHPRLMVRVYKSDFLSAFGHDHDIQAPIQSGRVKADGDASVELLVDTRKLRILDTDLSGDTRQRFKRRC